MKKETHLILLIILILSFGIFEQSESQVISNDTTLYGHSTMIDNPCTTDPCLPCMVDAIICNEDFYVLNIDDHWFCGNFSWKGYEPREGDSLIVHGQVIRNIDLQENEYYEIILDELKSFEDTSGYITGTLNLIPFEKDLVNVDTVFSISTTQQDYILTIEGDMIQGVIDFDNVLFHENDFVSIRGFIREKFIEILGNNHIELEIIEINRATNSINNYSNDLFYIYPNPVGENGIITIKTAGYLDYDIISIDGKKLLKGYLQSKQEQLDLKKLNPGIYFLLLKDKNMSYLVTKFIIN